MALSIAVQPLAAEDWPQWRGPNSTGVSNSYKPLPTEFSPTKNVRWSVEVRDGICLPTVVASRVFMTAILGEKPRNRFIDLCFDAGTGKKLWQREMDVKGEPLANIHASNSYASATLAVGKLAQLQFRLA